jgi:hypothetical protein
MKIPESKRSEIGIIAEFRGIPNRFPNQACRDVIKDVRIVLLSMKHKIL